MIHKHFGKKNPLSKIFNKNNMRVSYSCMPNMKQYINAHNRKILKGETKEEQLPCNCRDACPLGGQGCRDKHVIYKASVSSEDGDKYYVGLASTEFKERYRNHKMSFKKPSGRKATELSKYVWKLADEGKECRIQWSILKKVKPSATRGITCNLCLHETRFIMDRTDNCLNKRTEMLNKCRHLNEGKLFCWTREKPKKTRT